MKKKLSGRLQLKKIEIWKIGLRNYLKGSKKRQYNGKGEKGRRFGGKRESNICLIRISMEERIERIKERWFLER